MGEHATYRGQTIKIGTCEDMYYLRLDQASSVTPQRGSVAPAGRERVHLRFRLPFPDEDHVAPGEFGDPFRAVPIYGTTLRAPEHHSVQFTAHAGYLTSLPCPESLPEAADGLVAGRVDAGALGAVTIHRNGFAGRLQLVQVKPLADGRAVPILQCGGCKAKFRVESPEEIAEIVVALRRRGDMRNPDYSAEWWHTLADRIAALARLDGIGAPA